MTKPIFSAIITNYNYGHFLAECIDSVLAQTVPREEVEIIVVDDGSTDKTPQVVEPYVRKGLIRYIAKPNGGHASALNLGYASSSGEIVALMDADDLWQPDKLKAVKEVYDAFHCDAVFHNVGRFTNSGDQLKPFRMESHLRHWMTPVSGNLFRSQVKVYTQETDFLAILSAQTYTRKLCEKLFPIPEVFIRHTDAYLNYLCYVFTDVYFDIRMLTRYRSHPQSHMASLRQKRERKYLELEMRLEGVMLREIRKRAFPRVPPGLETVQNIWILHRAEALLGLGKKSKAVKLLVKSFAAGELKIGRHELIKKIFWVVASPRLFSFVRQFYQRLGLVHLRCWWVAKCKAKREAIKLRAMKISNSKG